MKKENGQATVWVLGSILGIILLIGLTIGGYQLGWWLNAQKVNRTAKINRTSYEVQQTYREEVLKDMSDVSDLKRQIEDPAYKDSVSFNRAALANKIRVTCDHISRLTTSGAGVDPDIQSFHDQECLV